MTTPMKKNLWLLALCQGLLSTNNVVFIAINGLVGLQLAPFGWMATLPVMAYVVGGALSTPLVARSQARWGRQVSFQIGLTVAVASAALPAMTTVRFPSPMPKAALPRSCDKPLTSPIAPAAPNVDRKW